MISGVRTLDDLSGMSRPGKPDWKFYFITCLKPQTNEKALKALEQEVGKPNLCSM